MSRKFLPVSPGILAYMKEENPTDQVWSEGSKSWYIDGNLHRVDGPAIEWADGSKFWYKDDNLHRVDGPAVEWASGSKDWYIDGEPTKGETND